MSSKKPRLTILHNATKNSRNIINDLNLSCQNLRNSTSATDCLFLNIKACERFPLRDMEMPQKFHKEEFQES